MTLTTVFYTIRQLSRFARNRGGFESSDLYAGSYSSFHQHFASDSRGGFAEKRTTGIGAAAELDELLDVVDLLRHFECRLLRRRLVGRRRGIVRAFSKFDNPRLSGRAQCGLELAFVDGARVQP